MKFILASASDRRKELLSRIISDFEVKISDFDEGTVEVSKDIEKYVKTLAEGKAKSVALNCTNDSIIIGADTIVVIDDNILGKPKDKDDAFRMLKLLSNNVHRVYSGVTVINNEKQVMKSECLYTEVYFSELSDEEIWNVLKKVCLDDKVKNLDNGLDHDLENMGGILSGGEKQRLVLARVLIRDYPILILDEVTSALDEKTAIRIENNILADNQLTLIMISHHIQEEIKQQLTECVELKV